MTAAYRLDITLEEPTILTDGSSDSSGGHETLTSILGTSVLGAMVAALGVDPDRDGDLFRHAFLSDTTCFLNAYPLAAGERALPRPRTFRQGKFDRRRVIDAITARGERRPFEEIQRFFEQAAPPDRPKAAAAAFVLASQPGVDRTPNVQEQVHVAIDRRRRAAEEGVLFTYSSLPAGSEFRSFVTTTEAAVAARLDAACRGPLRLRVGRSRGGGYGTATARLERIDAEWSECEVGPHGGVAVIVTLLSDYLPSFELPVVDALAADLRRAGGLPMTTTIEPVDTAVRTVTGFRGVWGLPRAPRTALQKGSVFLVHGEVDAVALQRAVAEGLGGRRNEGFGRIAIDWRIHGAETATTASRGEPHAAAKGLRRPQAADSPRVRGILAAMTARRHERQRRRFVEVALAHGKTQAAIAALVRIPPAQLGNLRAAMSGGLDAESIGRWFTDLAAKTAGDRWKKARVPALEPGGFRRNGVGFVWTSLLGGTTRHRGNSDEPEGGVNFKTAVERSLKQLCADATLHEAAVADPDRTLRLFVIGLCGDVVRHRNLTATARGATT